MTFRTEYPRPQFQRDDWHNLNGTWQFAFDDNNIGIDKHWYDDSLAGTNPFDRRIEVPFAYQAKLSGIGTAERHDVVWYRRKVDIAVPDSTHRVILHFGAVDYEASVYVNGHQVIQHVGGNTPFDVDITSNLNQDTTRQTIVVRAFDPQDDEQIPRGKQFWEPQSSGIWYTNTTGIWQTVWYDVVSTKRLENVHFTTLLDDNSVICEAKGIAVGPQDSLRYAVRYKDIDVASGTLQWVSDELTWTIDFVQNHIFCTGYHGGGDPSWTPEHPNLFDVELTVIDGDANTITDRVDSYFGIRKVHTERGMVYLNNRPYYQKLVLDQGYWPDGLLTAPSDEDYRRDIELSKSLGFNGCRKHQKMEDPRFLYWADKIGYIVWGECASAPVYTKPAVDRLMREWQEIVDRDYNHPCILTWVPLNESWGVPHIHTSREQQHFSQTMYHYLHAIDPTRLVESNDGWEQTETDICAIHNYNHGRPDEPERYQEYISMLFDKESLLASNASGWNIYAHGFTHHGEPIMLTEFGGIGFDVSGQPGWGYISADNADEFVSEYARLMKAVYASSGLWGYCYTQLTDVEQEINGLLTYDRAPKCDPAAIKAINDGYHISRVQ